MKEIKEMSLEEMRLEMQQYKCDKNEGYAFISYSHRDREIVYPLVLSWMRDGYNIYIDLDFERHGSDSSWVDMMSRTLANRMCRLAICFGSTHYTYSYAALLELLTIRGNKVTNRHNGILAVDYFVLGEISMDNNDVRGEYKAIYKKYFQSLQAEMGGQFMQKNSSEYEVLYSGLKDWNEQKWMNGKESVGKLEARKQSEKDTEEQVRDLRDAYQDGYMNFFPEVAKLIKEWVVSQGLNSNYYSQDSNLNVRRERFDEMGVERIRSAVKPEKEKTAPPPPKLKETPPAKPKEAPPAKPKEALPIKPQTPAPEKKAPVKQREMTPFEALKAKANGGDVNAQNQVGVKLYVGDGVSKNFEAAVLWFQKAAEQGSAYGQYNLGICHENGTGVEKNLVQAAYWYQKSAEQGHKEAQFKLGVCYKNAKGLEQNFVQAVYWYQKAADQGHAQAQNNLGLCYEEGSGVKQDQVQAVYWYQKSAEQGCMYGQYSLGLCYWNGMGVEKNPVQAAYWYKKAAEQGHAQAQNNLGLCYDNGSGVKKDMALAVYWYRKAAEQGYATAQKNLGLCYETGDGVKQDSAQAEYWFMKAAEQGEW